ncbi:hypothetical protein [Desulforamulus ruminis]|uniref:Ribbon-helix-helix protein CopG domain-containing protein n=1 Tax=Desulforamulus ruminis (strain ATCC 23193 / DSM 2154 / NCIMB 8452 / DL) TaxID=696281 RepID=F6DSF3_DESRL|nr:hypothetical protein [Desulforamulus ruminis]AEG61043.1 hypothetical protein Desru_2829 [Desulforamulus ruminis DSM 2154]
MNKNIEKHMEKISQEQVLHLSNFQEINIVSNKQTITQIKKLSQQSGLPVSRVIEAIIRAGLEDLPVAVS